MTDTTEHIEQDAEPSIAEAYMVGDLVEHLAGILRNQIMTWEQKTDAERDEEMQRLQRRVSQCVRKAVSIVAAKGCISIRASVEAVNIKAEGIKATLTVAKSSGDRHHLFDAAGEDVLIVLPQYELALESERPQPKAGANITGDEPQPADLISEA